MKYILLLLLFIFSQNSFAKDIIVFYAKGDVKITNLENEERKALKGTNITEGEQISTGNNSFVILKIDGHSVHRVEENSNLLINNLPYNFKDSDELEEGGSFYLKLGTIFSEVTQKSDTNSLTIKTKNSTMGVRGTKLMVSKGQETNDTWVSVKEGVVEVQNEVSGNHDLLLNKQSLVIESDKNFTKQKVYEWQNKLSWTIDKPIEIEKSFRSQRKLERMEFRKKRSNWTRKEALFKSKMNEWKTKNEKYKIRTKDFKPNPQKIIRKERLKEKISIKLKDKRLKKSTRQLYKGILNQDQDIKLNDFAKSRLDKSNEKIKIKRIELEKMRRQRTRRNLPRPPAPGGISGNNPAGGTPTTVPNDPVNIGGGTP